MNAPIADRAEIDQGISLLFDLGDVVEVRVPKTRAGVVAGYFDDHDKLAAAIQGAGGKYRAGGVYYVLNRTNPGCSGAYNRGRPLNDTLACRVTNWRLAPGRFIKADRSWAPQYRLAPLMRLDDAFQLMDRVAIACKLVVVKGGRISAEVQVGGRVGKASGDSNGAHRHDGARFRSWDATSRLCGCSNFDTSAQPANPEPV